MGPGLVSGQGEILMNCRLSCRKEPRHECKMNYFNEEAIKSMRRFIQIPSTTEMAYIAGEIFHAYS